MLKQENEIDLDIVNRLFEIYASKNTPISKTKQEVIKEILDKKNVDYCGAYELMKHDKLKQECFE